MQYLAGIFDAEGSLSLHKNGSFPISLEMANEQIPSLFQETFQGYIYTRKRKDRKQTWAWKINSINSQAINFIESILPFSIAKHRQLWVLLVYLKKSRDERKIFREIAAASIRAYKTPYYPFRPNCSQPSVAPDSGFYQWLAGLIDGDGNFVCNRYVDNRNKRKYFGHQLSVSSIDPMVIEHIESRIPGTVTQCERTHNMLYKWTCKRRAEQSLCESILPFLRVKEKQCILYMQFLQRLDDIRRYEIINEIKHLNSL